MKAFAAFNLLLLMGVTARADSFHDAFGPRFDAAPGFLPAPSAQHSDALHRWNQIAINASGLDHAPSDQNHVFGEQLGPGRSARAMAIVHIAIYDAIMAIEPKYRSFTGVLAPKRPISQEVAIAQAAHDTLVALYPSQAAAFDAALANDIASAPARPKGARTHGISLGRAAAATILNLRNGDGSEVPEPQVNVDYFPSDLPGHWRQDPLSKIPLALGAHWGECRTFVLQSSDQFRVPAPPAMNSDAYKIAFEEAKNFGGDVTHTATQRTPEQTFIGTFWAYDGTPSLCAPPRLYNQIAVQLADQRRLKTTELARLLALVNTGMADAGMAAWESKYYWDFWRPVTGIRESDPGPAGSGDGNPNTVGDVDFHPLGAPASNLTGPNFTPPFPAYPSGHATFGGVLFQTLRRFFGTDALPFTFVSDEFNGITKDNGGNTRPLMPRSFSRLSQAEEENGQSRIYLGIHWSFDKTAGIAQGRQVADYVFDHAFQRRH